MSNLRFLMICMPLMALACRTKDDSAVDTDPGTDIVDADGDGYASDEDCDDADPTVHPGAEEACDGIDNDCDGETDEGAADASTWYADTDGDGFGDPASATEACEAESGWVADGTDCDDDDDDNFPGAAERCDGLDNDCDGEVDEDIQELWYGDADSDGYGNPDNELESCDPGEGWVADSTDCDDANSNVNPGMEETCNEVDDDCDGDVDEDLLLTFWADADSDGFGDPAVSVDSCEADSGYVDNDDDCDDSNSAINPDADEACNGYDDDCDGLVDDDDPDVIDMTTWYLDADADGFGLDVSTVQACEQPGGYAAYGGDCDDGDPAFNPGAAETDCTDPNDYNCDGSTGYADDDGDGWAACEDCDDTDAAVNPDATELCNGYDDDCDGDLDEDDAADAATWYADTDSDGYGDASITTLACSQPSGFVADGTDCDDADATINPAAAEACNGVDDDCDGDVDEGVMDTWYADTDGDGYGDPAATTLACTVPSGHVADDTDCDDTDAAVFPGADEWCNGYDDDCDGFADEVDALDVTTWYADRDADGYGDATVTTLSCTQPSGYVADDTDCDDFDDDIHPSATELCDGVDNDCDGTVDEDDAADASTWYADSDGDGYGLAGTDTAACAQPSGHVADDTDCDDTDAAVNPAASEICDGIDNDCDGLVDDDDSPVSGASTWYLDYDGDSYGGVRVSTSACVQPSGYVADSSDCDDSDASQYPGATETCNGEDDDCDGLVDDDDPDTTGATTWYADADGDGYGDTASAASACSAPSGYVADDTDCDDTDANINPSQDEACNGIDDDCDGTVDEADAVDATTWHADADGDGYGSTSYSTVGCSQPTGYVADDTDCDDTDAAQYPGAVETCNSEDDDCDGTVDEEGEVVDGDTYWLDADGDGTGVSTSTVVACSVPSGYADNDYDCDDSDPSNPVIVDVSTGSSTGSGTILDPVASVQDGIDLATSGCVLVFPGTYSESVDFDGRDISVIGMEGSGATTIDASSTGEPAVTFESGESSSAVLTGFTLTGGSGHVDYTSVTTSCSSISECNEYFYVHCGGGVYVSSSDPTLSDLVVHGHALPAQSVTTSGFDTWYVYSYGGGLCLLDSLATVSGVEVWDNYADQGGAVYVDETSSVTLSQAWVHANSASNGAGVLLDGGVLDLGNLLSTDNLADSAGGGLLVIEGVLTATNITLGADDAPSGGGLYAQGASTVELGNSIIYGAASGEGVLIDSTASFTPTYNDVYGNVGGEYSGITDPTGTDGNISEDPLFADPSSDDWTLGSGSPCIDAGDPAILDADGTSSDMGAYGGPYGSWM